MTTPLADWQLASHVSREYLILYLWCQRKTNVTAVDSSVEEGGASKRSRLAHEYSMVAKCLALRAFRQPWAKEYRSKTESVQSSLCYKVSPIANHLALPPLNFLTAVRNWVVSCRASSRSEITHQNFLCTLWHNNPTDTCYRERNTTT